MTSELTVAPSLSTSPAPLSCALPVFDLVFVLGSAATLVTAENWMLIKEFAINYLEPLSVGESGIRFVSLFFLPLPTGLILSVWRW
jgi:hypothetical protein